MRKLVLAIILLLALFSLVRAYSQTPPAPRGLAGIGLHPGLVEIDDGSTRLGISFGIMEKSAGTGRLNLLPLRAALTSGDRTVSIELNGLAFLLGSGASLGVPVTVTGVRAGDVVSVGGPVTVDGRVEGDVWAVGADVRLTSRAAVAGDVVAIGGRVTAVPGAAVGGAVTQLPVLKIPFVGLLGTGFSAQTLGLAGAALTFVLFGFALFLSSFYFTRHTNALYGALPRQWRQALITIAVSAGVVPLLAAFLIASVVGVFLLPLVALLVFVLALDGFLVVCMQLGEWLRGGAANAGSRSLHLFTSGLLALFVLVLPTVVGVLLTVLRSAAAARVGGILQVLGMALTAAGLLYGFGAALAYARSRADAPER